MIRHCLSHSSLPSSSSSRAPSSPPPPYFDRSVASRTPSSDRCGGVYVPDPSTAPTGPGRAPHTHARRARRCGLMSMVMMMMTAQNCTVPDDGLAGLRNRGCGILKERGSGGADGEGRGWQAGRVPFGTGRGRSCFGRAGGQAFVACVRVFIADYGLLGGCMMLMLMQMIDIVVFRTCRTLS